jgi:hypothetical protein
LIDCSNERSGDLLRAMIVRAGSARTSVASGGGGSPSMVLSQPSSNASTRVDA